MVYRCAVSVIVPTYNRAATIAENIAALLEQDFESYEIVYVDDGSTDETRARLGEFQSLGAGRFRTASIRHSGPGPARNAGVRLARGNLLLFTDDDTLVPRSWITRMVSNYHSCGHDALCGGFEPYELRTAAQRYLHHRMGIIFGDRPKRVNAAPMMNFIVSRTCFERAGGFNGEHLERAEDWDFCRRLRESGATLYYDPRVVVRHHYQEKWHNVLAQLKATGAAGVTICPGGECRRTGYVLYAVLRFLAAPLWLWKYYPRDLFRRALTLEACFVRARVEAYVRRFSGRPE